MAKSSKLEDYWKQHKIESLFKEITHNLVERMPPDPVLAMVQYLQKKFPKSFKTSTDNVNDDTISKKAANTLQSQAFISPRSPDNLLNTSRADSQGRRASNQSQKSGIISIPTAGSAFRDLLKNDTSISQGGEPEVNIRNLAFANRMGLQAVKLGKNIESDRDILEQELFQPTKIKSSTLSRANDVQEDPLSDNLSGVKTQEEPSVKQFIKYKQGICDENARRQHREKLAGLAMKVRENEEALFSDAAAKSGSTQRQQRTSNKESSSAKIIQQPIARSKDEEDILNDELSFRPRQRTRNRLSRSHSNTPNMGTQYLGDTMLTMKNGTTSMSMTQPVVCKLCGNIINKDTNLLKLYNQQTSADQTQRSLEVPPVSESVSSSAALVDDWFDEVDAYSPTASQQTSQTTDAITPQAIDLNLLKQNLFQPINDNATDMVGYRSLTNTTDDKTTSKQTKTSRLSESDIFSLDPDTRDRRRSSSRNASSPMIKRPQSDSPVFPSNRSSVDMTRSSPLRRILESTSAATALPNAQRRMSDRSLCKQAPHDSDDN